MHDVFLSHASADAVRAGALARSLEERNIRCWLAPRDVPGGADYGKSIVDAIRASPLMIVLISRAAVSSAHVKREVERAVSHGVPILPVRIEDTSPSGALEYFLSGSQTFDWLSGSAGRAATHIEQALRSSTSDTGEATSGQPRQAPDPDRRPPQRRVALLGVAAVATLAAVGGAALWAWGGDEPNGGGGNQPTPTVTPDATQQRFEALAREAEGWTIGVAESFDDNSKDWWVGRQTDDNGAQTYRLDDRGGYVIALEGNDDRGSYFSTLDRPVGSRLDAAVKVSFEEASGDAACGIAVKTVGDRYLFGSVSPGTGAGSGRVTRVAQSGKTDLLADSASLSSGGPVRVRLLLDETTGYLVVNDQLVGEFVTDGQDAVGVGMGAQFGDQVRCRFDDLVVRGP